MKQPLLYFHFIIFTRIFCWEKFPRNAKISKFEHGNIPNESLDQENHFNPFSYRLQLPLIVPYGGSHLTPFIAALIGVTLVTLVSTIQNSVVSPGLVKKLFKPRYPLQLAWCPPHTAFRIYHHPKLNQLLANTTQKYQKIFTGGVHPIRDYGHPGNLIPFYHPGRTGCTPLTLDRIPGRPRGTPSRI